MRPALSGTDKHARINRGTVAFEGGVRESLMSGKLFLAVVAIAILDGILIWLLVLYVAHRRPQLLKELWQRIKNFGLNP